MQTNDQIGDTNDTLYAEQRRAAYTYVSEAFAEGRYDGIDGDCLAHAALFAAFVELVATYGEDAVSKFAEKLPERIKAGEYSLTTKN
ncbi:MAG: hypothetical protein LCH38_13195 [Proteobacteria bacterium]|nr:hypothetical protein [Pseudomonadota bacterium]